MLNTNGIRAVFGKIIERQSSMFFRFAIVLGIVCTLQSCLGNGSVNCDREKDYYLESWDYEVEKTYKHEQYKATYVLKTTTKKTILFGPIQDIVSRAEPGDRVFKEKNSKYAFLINKYGDSLKSRIFSVSCDSIVLVNAQLSAETSVH